MKVARKHGPFQDARLDSLNPVAGCALQLHFHVMSCGKAGQIRSQKRRIFEALTLHGQDLVIRSILIVMILGHTHRFCPESQFHDPFLTRMAPALAQGIFGFGVLGIAHKQRRVPGIGKKQPSALVLDGVPLTRRGMAQGNGFYAEASQGPGLAQVGKGKSCPHKGERNCYSPPSQEIDITGLQRCSTSFGL